MDISLIIIGFIIIALGFTLFSLFYTVRQQTVAVIERFGKYNRIAHAGLNIKIPLVETISGLVSLKINQLDVTVDTKTKDNVFIKSVISVQYHVKDDRLYDAFYKLANPQEQITSFVFDVVRSEVPKMNLDDVFEKKDIIAIAVKEELTETMQGFGYVIVKALVTDIDPDEKVKTAMNEINEQQRLRIAATEKGEANKILQVKNAEADAESMKLQGEGVAKQRKAIVDGLRESLEDFQNAIPDSSSNDVMNLILMTQYFDTLKEIGAKNKSSTILLSHSPGALKDITTQLQDGIMVGNLAAKHAETEDTLN